MGNCLRNRCRETDLTDVDEKNIESSMQKGELSGHRHFAGGERFPAKARALLSESTQEHLKSQELQDFLRIGQKKSKQDLEAINEGLRRHFFLNNLNEEHQAKIINELKFFNVPEGKLIILQDKPSYFFWIIAKGAVEVTDKTGQISLLSKKDSFGEMSLISEAPSVVTVKTVENCGFWAIDRKTFRATIQAINSAEYSQNKTFIESVPMFGVLTKAQRELLLSSVTIVNFNDKQNIVVEGEPGDLFFIVKEGSVECKRCGTLLRKMGVGEYFGEQALLYNTTRTATVTAEGAVKCLVINRDDLTKALGNHLSQVIYKNSLRIAFEKSRLLSSLNLLQSNLIISKMAVSTWESGTIVIPKGTKKNLAMYVVLNGKLEEMQGNVWQVLSILGEEEMVKGVASEYPEITAIGRVDLASISKAEFESAIGNNFDRVASSNELLQTLKKVSLFRNLSNDCLKILMENLQIEEFEAEKVIFPQGSYGDSFYIVKQGKVNVLINNVLIRSINKLDYFGERALLFNESRSASVVSYEHSECWVLKKVDFFRIIDEKMRALLHKRIQLQDISISLDDLLVIKKLGTGMLGNVFLVSNKNNKHLYALKSIDRHKIDNEKIKDSLSLERKVLMQIDHSFILKLIKTFKDSKRIYFLLEYVRGEDLFDAIREIGLLSDKDARFYACCLLIILEHLHERDIVYRDLKPENVMVDEDGYPKLIDFGTAKIVTGRTYTMIGTPHYMAPEVILGKGYSASADYWSLGIMIYEFICGAVPFGESDSDSYIIFQKILEARVTYPNYAVPLAETRGFIEKMLDRNPALRSGGSFEQLKADNWLKDCEWDGFLEKRFPAPYVPILPNLEWDIEKAFSQNKAVMNLITDCNQYHNTLEGNLDWSAEF